MAHQFAKTPAANTLTDMTDGGVPAGKGGAYTFNACNMSDQPRLIRMGFTTGGAIVPAEYREFDAPLGPRGSGANVLSRWPIALDPGWKFFVWADGSDVAFGLNGEEG